VAYSDVVLADAPVAYWRLGAGATDLDDSSGNGHPFTKTGTVTEAASLLIGDGDTARDLPGLNTDFYEAADHADFDFINTAPFSLEAWVQPQAVTAAYKRFIAHENVGTNGFQMSCPSPNFAIYRTSAGVAVGIEVNPGTIVGRTWHVVGTYDSTNLRLYLNGVLAGGPLGDTANMGAVTNGVRTGINGVGPDYLDCILDEVAVYPTALSPTRVLEHYRAGNPPVVIPSVDLIYLRRNR
jgi:hypothetical protein